MTDTTNQQPTTPSPAQPQIDAAAIAKQAAEAAAKQATEIAKTEATKIADARMKEAARVLTGEKEKPEIDPLVASLLSNPVNILAKVKEITKEEIKAEQAEEAKFRQVQHTVASPYYEEYPEIKSGTKLALVEKLADKYVGDGLSYKEALDKGFKEAVKEFGLKPISERIKSGEYNAAALPGGGGGVVPGAPRRDEAKSQSDFLTGMKSRMSSFRVKSK